MEALRHNRNRKIRKLASLPHSSKILYNSIIPDFPLIWKRLPRLQIFFTKNVSMNLVYAVQILVLSWKSFPKSAELLSLSHLSKTISFFDHHRHFLKILQTHGVDTFLSTKGTRCLQTFFSQMDAWGVFPVFFPCKPWWNNTENYLTLSPTLRKERYVKNTLLLILFAT